MQDIRHILLALAFLAMAASAISFSDEKYYGQSSLRQLVNLFEQAIRSRDAATFQASAAKRNSEIINSILGLPKNLNDVGKK